MKLRFDSETAHQKAAVAAIVDLFEGQQPKPPQAAYAVAGNPFMATINVAPNHHTGRIYHGY